MIAKIKDYSISNKEISAEIEELDVCEILFRRHKRSGSIFGLKNLRKK